jgi:hypothetical protein
MARPAGKNPVGGNPQLIIQNITTLHQNVKTFLQTITMFLQNVKTIQSTSKDISINK